MSFESWLNTAVLREAHRGMVGRQIWCACGVVLDAARAVDVSIYRQDPGPEQARLLPGLPANTGPTLVQHTIVCARCADLADAPAVARAMAARLAARDGVPHTVEIVDGRDLWEPKPPKRPKYSNPANGARAIAARARAARTGGVK